MSVSRRVREVLSVLKRHGVTCNAVVPRATHMHYLVETPDGRKHKLVTSVTPSDKHWIDAVERDVERLLGARPSPYLGPAKRGAG
jgi:hypothetical protein